MVPTLSAQPLLYTLLICSVSAPLNFLRCPLELREARRPLERNPTGRGVREAATPGATHPTGARAAEDPRGPHTCAPRPGSAGIYASADRTGLAQIPGLPATRSRTLARPPPPGGFLKVLRSGAGCTSAPSSPAPHCRADLPGSAAGDWLRAERAPIGRRPRGCPSVPLPRLPCSQAPPPLLPPSCV